MFLNPAYGRRLSNEPEGPATGLFRLSCLRNRVPFWPKYDRSTSRSPRTGTFREALQCWMYGFGSCFEVEKMLGCTVGEFSLKTLPRSNCGSTGPLFLTSKRTNGGFRPNKNRLSPTARVS